MRVFIDESWDSWFKFDKSSSEYFTIAMVVFEDDSEYFSCDQRISLLRWELWYDGNHEFHFCNSSDRIKRTFFTAVSPYNFFFYGFILNKKKIYGEGFKNKQSFYKYVAGLLFENAKDKLFDAEICIDGSGDHWFRQSLSKYLKTKMNWNRRVIKSIKMLESHKINMLQLADFVASGLNREMKRPDKESYIDVINHRKIYVQIWPK